MKNNEIIIKEALERGIYTEEMIEKIKKAGGEVMLHTASEWGNRGYSVKENEKPIFKTKIWKKSSKNFFLVDAAIYSGKQVERKENG